MIKRRGLSIGPQTAFLLGTILFCLLPLAVTGTSSLLAQGNSPVDLSALDDVGLSDDSASFENDTSSASPAEMEETSEKIGNSESPSESSEEGDQEAPASGFYQFLKAGGSIGIIIFLLSFVACAMAIRLALLLRRKVFFPAALLAEFTDAAESGKLNYAWEGCRKSSSFIGKVLAGGLKYRSEGWEAMAKGLEESLSSESARLYRQSDFLMVIGNTAPMLGLLGTVLGMVTAFGELAHSDGLGRFAQLAEGIHFALVTTVDGLVVAIPTLFVYSILNHWIAERISETAALVDKLTHPIKLGLARRPNSASASAPTFPTASPASRPLPKETAQEPPILPPQNPNVPPTLRPTAVPPINPTGSRNETRRNNPFGERNDSE